MFRKDRVPLAKYNSLSEMIGYEKSTQGRFPVAIARPWSSDKGSTWAPVSADCKSRTSCGSVFEQFYRMFVS